MRETSMNPRGTPLARRGHSPGPWSWFQPARATGMRQPVPKARSLMRRPGRGLAPLELGQPHQTQHPPDRRLVEPRGDDLLGRLVALDVALEDVVEHVVGRQRVLVGLVGPELRRRGLGQDAPRARSSRSRFSHSAMR